MSKLFAVLALVFTSFFAQASLIVSPVSITTNMGNGFSGNIQNVINKSGLDTLFVSGVTNFNTYNPSAVSIQNVAEAQWWSAANVTSGFIDFDLGFTYLIKSLALWNDNFIFGVRDFRVFVSNQADFSASTLVGSFTANYDQLLGQEFDSTDTTARYVRFQVLNTYSYSANLNEVAFEVDAAQSVTEPGSLVFMFAGIFALLVGRRFF
jgi:hypothetical protein